MTSKLLQVASLCFVLLFACLYWEGKPNEMALSVPKQAGGSPGSQSGEALVINVTAAEYENALAKWRARGVEEYEITYTDSSVMLWGGKWSLRIRVQDGEPILVGCTNLNGEQPEAIPLDALDADRVDFFLERSVEETFGHIGSLFSKKFTDTGNVVNEYDVEFDDELGYPSRVHSRVYLREGGISPTECCLYYDVIDVTILKSTTPGMPRSGNPGT